jgi:predicted nucleic acid-binding protein
VKNTLVDSSAWIDFLRGDRAARERIDPLLADDRVAITGVVFAEVLSGARDRPSFNRLERVFGALPLLPDPPGIWHRVAEARFALARAGFQAAVTDLLIAIAALDSARVVVTRDRDFERIRSTLPFDLDRF